MKLLKRRDIPMADTSEKLLKNTGASPRKNIKKKNVRSFYHATNQRAYETIIRHVQHALRLLLLL